MLPNLMVVAAAVALVLTCWAVGRRFQTLVEPLPLPDGASVERSFDVVHKAHENARRRAKDDQARLNTLEVSLGRMTELTEDLARQVQRLGADKAALAAELSAASAEVNARIDALQTSYEGLERKAKRASRSHTTGKSVAKAEAS